MVIRALLLTLVASLISMPVVAQTPPATPGDAVDDHVAWVLGIFDGGAEDLVAADVEARLDAAFLELVPAEVFIATVVPLAETLGPLELVEELDSDANEHIATYRAASGDGVMISLAVDPATGLVVGLFITPTALPSPDAATPVVAAEASLVASPVPGAPVVADPAAQIAAYAEKQEAIRAVAEPVRDAVLTGDDAAVEPHLGPVAAAALGDTSLQDVIDGYTQRQLQMAFPEAGIVFFGQWNDTEIAGVMVQNGAPYAFALTAEGAQGGDRPDGRWTGALTGAGLGLEIAFEARGDGDLSATLSIPTQGLRDAPLSDVVYLAERPIGDLVDERVFAPGGGNDSYTADYAWSDHLLRVTVAVDVASGLVSGVQVIPAVPTTTPETVPASDTAWRLPFGGTWWVFWGGEDALRNYHVSAPAQRYAYDLVIWKDGATWKGDGARNEDYWVWGQPVLAPADGEVVEAVRDEPDLPPNASMAERSRNPNPGGNHVVLQTAEGEYVMLAHMQQGSVRVEVGDEVRAGDPIGLVGNSGNSSEPHLHIHAQDSPDLLDYDATGIPLRFDTIRVDGKPADDAVPVQGSFIAPTG